jgi:hypothetical protein
MMETSSFATKRPSVRSRLAPPSFHTLTGDQQTKPVTLCHNILTRARRKFASNNSGSAIASLNETQLIASCTRLCEGGGVHVYKGLMQSSIANGSSGSRDSSVLGEIWAEVRSSENLDRLGRFLEQVRGTPFESAVEEPVERVESAKTTSGTADWPRQSRPLLERVKALYATMGWNRKAPSLTLIASR